MYPRRTNQIVLSALEEQAAVVLLGPRQVGKTTLALELAEQRVLMQLKEELEHEFESSPSEAHKAIQPYDVVFKKMVP